MENKLQDLARAKGRKLNTDLKPGPLDPPSAEKISGPGSMKPSAIVTVKKPVYFDGFFSIKLTTRTETILSGEFRWVGWEDTFIYQDGAYRFVGPGAWPFWEWEDEDSFDKTSPEPTYVPTPLDFDAGTVDEVIPFEMTKAVAALQFAMESQNCNVKEATVDRIVCKRPRVYATSRNPGSGGESVTALLEPKGDQTRVRISTGKGFYGRLVKQNWSTPIYREALKSLQEAQQRPAESPSQASVSSGVAPAAIPDKTPVNSANWGYNPAPGARLELKEAQRRQGKRGTAITYHVESSGFPTGKTYSLWMMQSGDHKTSPVLTGYSANVTGALVCPGQSQPGDPPAPGSHCFPLERASLDVDNYHNGEPVDFAIISTDGTVRAYARAYPFPIQAQDGKCTLNAELENTKFNSFVIRGAGFEPGENVATSSSLGSDPTAGTQQASSRGEFAAEIQVGLPGKNSGSATFAATGKSCHLTVTYEWGKAAKQVR